MFLKKRKAGFNCVQVPLSQLVRHEGEAGATARCRRDRNVQYKLDGRVSQTSWIVSVMHSSSTSS